MAENPNPTRMELLKAKTRVKLARKGHKLLKQKRDALIMEFFKILGKAQDLRSELNSQMKKAYTALAVAQAYQGMQEIEAASLSVKRVPGVKVDVRNIMGVKIPSLESSQVEKPLLSRGYSVVGTSAKIDEVAEAFEKATDLVFKLSQTENAIRRLILEIEKTKRRVNSLEFVMIPRLETQAKMISFRLEEMERDSFVMLKTIKRKLEKAEASG
ncbi:TPA: V-type ATP synthase subunit D [Candidatus Micrarchaeota archaeon]|nr:V-type ATP synthase subunit D [Candidatus Micrarchaeota archaeon]HIH30300.1 V-type ATP synthase subunit D [Candidatus Micrarchaeota archaeon]